MLHPRLTCQSSEHAPQSRILLAQAARLLRVPLTFVSLDLNTSLRMKIPIYSIVLLHLLDCWPSSARELSAASVAERIAKDEGYQLFRFTSETAQPYQVAVRFNGAENVQDIQDVPSVKECIVAVRLGKDNTLEAVRVYYDRGVVGMAFQPGHFPAFNSSIGQAEIQLNDPFLTLKSEGGELQIILRPRKA